MEPIRFGGGNMYSFDGESLSHIYTQGSDKINKRHTWTITKDNIKYYHEPNSRNCIEICTKDNIHKIVGIGEPDSTLSSSILWWLRKNMEAASPKPPKENSTAKSNGKVKTIMDRPAPMVTEFWGRYSLVNRKLKRSKGIFVEPKLKAPFELDMFDVKDYNTNKQIGIGRTNGHGVTKALVGGALFGGLGAITGVAAGRGKDKRMLYELTITVHDKDGKSYYIDLFDMFNVTDPIMVDDFKYQKMIKAYDELVSFFKYGTEYNKNKSDAIRQQKLVAEQENTAEKSKYEIDEDEYQEFLEFMEWKKMKGKQ